uniref:NADH-ubiquinone oxidoreductase chain 2 n=1 Tax=Byrrhinus sp. BYR01 TaxID=1205541 RepID=A0A0S2MRH2_9COLE|nr:NADH deshydrogenase subunit 2 [Byrrhinus sp. BYR01]
MKNFKIMFYSTLMAGTMISISASSWLGMWLGLEINLLSIIPLMITKKTILSNESALKYFITQAIASTIILFSALLFMNKIMSNYDINQPLSMMIMDSALLIKMGAAPFHFWFPEVMEGLQWMNCLIMLTWQKIAPMIILMYNMTNMVMIALVIITSMAISGIMGLNQTSLRKILTYSSINHIGWMLSSMMFVQKIWMIYFTTYTLITINLVLMFSLTNAFSIKQMFTSMTSSNMKILFSLNFFSLGGLPPFLGFFPKWLTIQTLIENNMLILTFIMTIMTLLTLYFYMRIAFTAMLLVKNENNWNLNLKMKTPSSLNLMILNFITIAGLIIFTP